MNPKLLLLSFTATFAALGLLAQTAPPWATAPDSSSAAAPVVIDRGPHHRQWARIESVTDRSGQSVIRTNLAYVELATGMHYLKDGQWLESQEIIEAFPGGAVARQGQHQVIFANNLATAGAIDMQTPDGKRLTSHLLGLSYFDAASGTNILIAEVKDCQGKIVPPNAVLYEDAMTEIKCSVRYTYTRGGFEQDIILLESPPSPQEYGLNPATTRLTVMTEFVNPPQPTKEIAVSADGSGMQMSDETLNFGVMQVGSGQAFSLGGASTAKLRVFKQWMKMEGRDFLVEQIPVPKLLQAIDALPKNQGASLRKAADAVRFMASTSRRLPTLKPAKAAAKGMELAKAQLPARGFLLDFFSVITTNNFSFQSDTTFYVSGMLNLSGTTRFEGGTVIKYAPTNNASLNINGPAVWAGSMYRPAILTARDDNSVGQTITGSTGNPTTNFYASAMLSLIDESPLKYLRLCYANNAIQISYSIQKESLTHVQFVNCRRGINDIADDDIVFTLRNVLLSNVTNLSSSANYLYFYGENVTVERVTNSSANVNLTNSLFVATSGFSGGTSNAYLGSTSGVFQTVGAASYYLADNSPYRNAGATNVSILSDLKLRTTFPPIIFTNNVTSDMVLSPQAQRDTDVPDLGYHYDPLDYVCKGVSITSTAVMTNGVAIGTYGPSSSYGIAISGQGQVISEGSAPTLNYIVRYNTVQEQSTTNWSSSSVAPSVLLSSETARAQCRFTAWSMPGGTGDHLNTSYETNFASFTHCQFTGGTLTFYPGSIGLTNCLLERTYLTLNDDFYDNMAWSMFNNLLRGGTLYYRARGSGILLAYDNLFDRTAITRATSSAYFTHGYNAYVTNANRLISNQATDKILTNSPVYQASWLGSYYYPTNDGMLSTLIDAGSRWATNAGLFHYTTTTNQVIETNTMVDIGYHYVAVDPSTRLPYDYDGDGTANYLEDRTGDGAYNTGDLSDWKTYDSPNGLTPGSGLQVFTPLK